MKNQFPIWSRTCPRAPGQMGRGRPEPAAGDCRLSCSQNCSPASPSEARAPFASATVAAAAGQSPEGTPTSMRASPLHPLDHKQNQGENPCKTTPVPGIHHTQGPGCADQDKEHRGLTLVGS